MALQHEEKKSAGTNIMYIRGIPFKCPTPKGKDQPEETSEPTSNSECRREAAVSPQRLLARCATAADSRNGVSLPEAKAQAERMKNRRSVRLFSEASVPLRLLRDLVGTACGPVPDGTARLARFVMAESLPSVSRIAGLTAAWLRREGILLDGPSPETDARHVVFGGAPHVAVAYGPADSAAAASACALAVARLEWAAAGAGLGTCFAGELVQAAGNASEVAAALCVPHGHAAFAALLIGYPAFPVDSPATVSPATLIWI